MSFSDYQAMIQEVAARKGWDPALLAAQAWAESGFNPTAVSYAGAKGIMQFMDRTWQAFSRGRSVWDPLASFEGAVDYLLHIQKVLGDGLASPMELTLASYNWGEGNVQKLIKRTGRTDWGYLRGMVPAETRDYVDKILAKAPTFRAAFGLPEPQGNPYENLEAMDADTAAAAIEEATGGPEGGWITPSSAGLVVAIALGAVLVLLMLRRMA